MLQHEEVSEEDQCTILSLCFRPLPLEDRLNTLQARSSCMQVTALQKQIESLGEQLKLRDASIAALEEQARHSGKGEVVVDRASQNLGAIAQSFALRNDCKQSIHASSHKSSSAIEQLGHE